MLFIVVNGGSCIFARRAKRWTPFERRQPTWKEREAGLARDARTRYSGPTKFEIFHHKWHDRRR